MKHFFPFCNYTIYVYEVLVQGDSVLVPNSESSSYPGFELSRVRVIQGSSYPGFELSRVRVIEI